MSRTHLVISDQHAHPDYSQERADYLSRLIIDVRPEVVVNIGDAADMTSLASYDRGKRSFFGKSYRKDIESHLEFQDRLWSPVRATKKKMPERVFMIGNHEQRIDRALDMSPELEGTIGYKDLDLESHYNLVVPYEGDTPGIAVVDGVAYAHYFITGIMGRGIAGEHPAYTLLTKNFQSCTQGHSHVADWCVRTNAEGRHIQGLVVGVYQDYAAPWAGERNELWWRGVVLCHNVEDGVYDPEFIGIERLKKEYGGQ